MSKLVGDVTVSDARKPLKMAITEDDYRAGIKNDPARCAAAQAVRRQYGAEDVRIHKTRAYVKINGAWKRYIVPQAVYREIVAFDRGASFEAGEFFLRPPDEDHALGNHQSWRERVRRSARAKKQIRDAKTRKVRPDGPHAHLLYESLA